MLWERFLCNSLFLTCCQNYSSHSPTSFHHSVVRYQLGILMLIQSPRRLSEMYWEKYCNMQHLTNTSNSSNSLIFHILLPAPLRLDHFMNSWFYTIYVLTCLAQWNAQTDTPSYEWCRFSREDSQVLLRFSQWSCSFKTSLKQYPAGSWGTSDDSRCKVASK